MLCLSFFGGTPSGRHVEYGANNGCSTVIKAQSAKETLKKLNTINRGNL